MIAPATHRGICNGCRHEYTLRADGTIRAHVSHGAECRGSWRPARKNTVRAVVRQHLRRAKVA